RPLLRARAAARPPTSRALAFEQHWGSSRLVCAASGSVAGCARWLLERRRSGELAAFPRARNRSAAAAGTMVATTAGHRETGDRGWAMPASETPPPQAAGTTAG